MCKGICPYLYICFWYLALWVRCWHARLLREIRHNRPASSRLWNRTQVPNVWYDMICNPFPLDPCKQRTTHIFHLDVMVFFSNSKCISPNWNHMPWLNHRILGLQILLPRLDDNWQGQIAWCQSLTVGFVLHDLSWMKWYDVLVLL